MHLSRPTYPAFTPAQNSSRPIAGTILTPFQIPGPLHLGEFTPYGLKPKQRYYSSDPAATTTITPITNHDAYHLPPQQQHVQYTPYNNNSNNNNNNNNNNSQHLLSPYPHQPGAQYYHPLVPQHQPQYSPPHQPGYRPHGVPYYSSYTDSPTPTDYLPPGQNLPQQQHLHPQQLQQQQQPQPPPPPQPQQHQQSPLVFNQPTTSSPPNAMPRGKVAAQVAKEPEIMESPVRTKFPTARIKRIMQADEEVGKVAQQTPIAVGKALELFMVQLVHKSAEVAKEKNSKRITAPMLKQAIDSTNEWDFLREIVAKVTEEKEGAKSGGRPKAESDSDDDADTGEVRKKGRGGRKKKAAV
ncbi:hypothetical protein EKO27_g4729 [Xylaria grammica]|uniref:NCT transcriptional regulatory complex subunit A n=1 Tax=Xylaria grammica TaxID=363999 RepID=A0A439D7L9_9PEZI|nr:hypothetical protein EKO27_g4729 [Xylaria grammica]